MTTPSIIETNLADVLGEIKQQLNGIQRDVTDLKIDMARDITDLRIDMATVNP